MTASALSSYICTLTSVLISSNASWLMKSLHKYDLKWCSDQIVYSIILYVLNSVLMLWYQWFISSLWTCTCKCRFILGKLAHGIWEDYKLSISGCHVGGFIFSKDKGEVLHPASLWWYQSFISSLRPCTYQTNANKIDIGETGRWGMGWLCTIYFRMPCKGFRFLIDMLWK